MISRENRKKIEHVFGLLCRNSCLGNEGSCEESERECASSKLVLFYKLYKIEQNLTLLTLCSVTFSKFSFQFKEERNLLKIYAKLYKENMHSILAISTETDAINMDHSKRTISFE